MVEANLNKKTLELSSVQRQAITTETTWELAEKRAEELQGKLNETEVKFYEVSSIVSTQDKELVDLKETMKNYEQVFYNMGFKDVENLDGAVVFQAQKFAFVEGWMAVLCAVGEPKGSAFRDASQIPLPNDPPIKA